MIKNKFWNWEAMSGDKSKYFDSISFAYKTLASSCRSCLPAFSFVSVYCNRMFPEHPSTADASNRNHLMFTPILGGRHNYSSPNADEVTKAGKGTYPNLFSWQLTDVARIWNWARSGVRLFHNYINWKVCRVTFSFLLFLIPSQLVNQQILLIWPLKNVTFPSFILFILSYSQFSCFSPGLSIY